MWASTCIGGHRSSFGFWVEGLGCTESEIEREREKRRERAREREGGRERERGGERERDRERESCLLYTSDAADE